ncbi:VanZ family protein [Pirellulales bacterium]|nr:VanZ family protein [Pirellulales bacterium]
MKKSYIEYSVQDSTARGRNRVLGATLLGGFVLYSIVLVIATHLPNGTTVVRFPGFDKLLHFGAYGCQATLAMGVLCVVGRASSKSIVLLVVALACFGGIDEITQPVFGRQAEFLDWVADCVGIVLAVWCVWSFSRFTGAISPRRTTPS